MKITIDTDDVAAAIKSEVLSAHAVLEPSYAFKRIADELGQLFNFDRWEHADFKRKCGL